MTPDNDATDSVDNVGGFGNAGSSGDGLQRDDEGILIAVPSAMDSDSVRRSLIRSQ